MPPGSFLLRPSLASPSSRPFLLDLACLSPGFYSPFDPLNLTIPSKNFRAPDPPYYGDWTAPGSGPMEIGQPGITSIVILALAAGVIGSSVHVRQESYLFLCPPEEIKEVGYEVRWDGGGTPSTTEDVVDRKRKGRETSVLETKRKVSSTASGRMRNDEGVEEDRRRRMVSRVRAGTMSDAFLSLQQNQGLPIPVFKHKQLSPTPAPPPPSMHPTLAPSSKKTSPSGTSASGLNSPPLRYPATSLPPPAEAHFEPQAQSRTPAPPHPPRPRVSSHSNHRLLSNQRRRVFSLNSFLGPPARPSPFELLSAPSKKRSIPPPPLVKDENSGSSRRKRPRHLGLGAGMSNS